MNQRINEPNADQAAQTNTMKNLDSSRLPTIAPAFSRPFNRAIVNTFTTVAPDGHDLGKGQILDL